MNIFKIRKSNKEQIEAISEALSLSNKKYFFSTSIVFCKEIVINTLMADNLSINQDHLFELKPITLPWFHSVSGVADYRTVEKTSISFWMHETKPVTITIKDKTGKELWKVDMKGQQGFNEYRWDLITKRQDSLLPYFTEYETYIRPGDYTLVWSDGRSELKRDIRVQTRERPQKE